MLTLLWIKNCNLISNIDDLWFYIRSIIRGGCFSCLYKVSSTHPHLPDFFLLCLLDGRSFTGHQECSSKQESVFPWRPQDLGALCDKSAGTMLQRKTHEQEARAKFSVLQNLLAEIVDFQWICWHTPVIPAHEKQKQETNEFYMRPSTKMEKIIRFQRISL